MKFNKLKGFDLQADVRGVADAWKDLNENVNFVAGNLTNQLHNIAEANHRRCGGD